MQRRRGGVRCGGSQAQKLMSCGVVWCVGLVAAQPDIIARPPNSQIHDLRRRFYSKHSPTPLASRYTVDTPGSSLFTAHIVLLPRSPRDIFFPPLGRSPHNPRRQELEYLGRFPKHCA
jgi:hypothetical protein